MGATDRPSARVRWPEDPVPATTHPTPRAAAFLPLRAGSSFRERPAHRSRRPATGCHASRRATRPAIPLLLDHLRHAAAVRSPGATLQSARPANGLLRRATSAGHAAADGRGRRVAATCVASRDECPPENNTYVLGHDWWRYGIAAYRDAPKQQIGEPNLKAQRAIMQRRQQAMTARSARSESASQMTRFSAPKRRHPVRTVMWKTSRRYLGHLLGSGPDRRLARDGDAGTPVRVPPTAWCAPEGRPARRAGTCHDANGGDAPARESDRSRQDLQDSHPTRRPPLAHGRSSREFETCRHRPEHRKVGRPLSTCGLSTSE